jgi:hypothetical protein
LGDSRLPVANIPAIGKDKYMKDGEIIVSAYLILLDMFILIELLKLIVKL